MDCEHCCGIETLNDSEDIARPGAVELCPRHPESNVAALEGKLALADATYRDSEHCLRQRIAEIAALEATVKALREALEYIYRHGATGFAMQRAGDALDYERETRKAALCNAEPAPEGEKETK